MSNIPSCPLCGNHQSSLFDQRTFRGQQVTNRICNHCGLVYQSPRMSESELTSYYEREYRLEYQGVEGPNSKDLATQRGRAKSITGFIRSKRLTITRHLDIGCSAGLLLTQIQETYQCTSIGIEPGKAYRKFAQEKGLVVYPSLEDLEQDNQEHFDLISMAHVLEHLPNPVEYLNHMRKTLLTPAGHILIEVPNLYSHDCFETAHMVSYSAHTLGQTLQQAGFSPEFIEAHGRPRSSVIPLYLTLLAKSAGQDEVAPSVIKPERQVAIKRKIGMLRRKFLTRLMPSKAWLDPETTC